MARSDLLVSLIKAGTIGDRKAFRAVSEAIIAEERAKSHNVLADQLARAVQAGSSNGSQQHAISASVEAPVRSRDFMSELVPRKRVDDLILPPSVRRSIEELIEEQQRADVLRAHGLEPRHRVLLVGPPGTGKTSLAEGIAEATGVPMFLVRYESIIGSFLGETAGRLKRVFDYARTIPCVLFFDEFDAIGKERGDIHETGEIKRVVTSLLMQVDELPSYTIVAAATNHPELLDRASWRRFQLRVSLPMPSTGAIADYIAAFSARFDEEVGYAPAVLAKQLDGISFAEVEEFCLDLQRRKVLAMGNRSLKSIVATQLQSWGTRAKAHSSGEKGKKRARTPNTSTTKS
jgi:SpoVK/Ycf46/Vps4 family AAA+-type ATPase